LDVWVETGFISLILLDYFKKSLIGDRDDGGRKIVTVAT